jgi:hypothetical protein
MWVEKTYAKKPPPLGVTLGSAGNDYDYNPPSKPEPNSGGRPPAARDKAQAFIVAKLQEENDRQATALCTEWESTGNSSAWFWRARDFLVASNQLSCEGKPFIMHLLTPISTFKTSKP